MNRRIKKSIIIVGIIVIILAVLSVIGFKVYGHYTSIEYKLEQVGYSEKEISKIVKKDEKFIEKALKKHNKDLLPLTEEKYFIWNKLNEYLSYINKLNETNNIIDYSMVITRVNTKTNYPFYTIIILYI